MEVHEFVEEHNHELHLVETSHMLASQQKISQVQAHEIEMVKDFKLQQKAYFDLISKHVRGRANLGYTHVDAKNDLQAKR